MCEPNWSITNCEIKYDYEFDFSTKCINCSWCIISNGSSRAYDFETHISWWPVIMSFVSYSNTNILHYRHYLKLVKDEGYKELISLHILRKLISSPLSKELRTKYNWIYPTFETIIVVPHVVVIYCSGYIIAKYDKLYIYIYISNILYLNKFAFSYKILHT